MEKLLEKRKGSLLILQASNIIGLDRIGFFIRGKNLSALTLIGLHIDFVIV